MCAWVVGCVCVHSAIMIMVLMMMGLSGHLSRKNGEREKEIERKAKESCLYIPHVPVEGDIVPV